MFCTRYVDVDGQIADDPTKIYLGYEGSDQFLQFHSRGEEIHWRISEAPFPFDMNECGQIAVFAYTLPGSRDTSAWIDAVSGSRDPGFIDWLTLRDEHVRAKFSSYGDEIAIERLPF